MRRLKGDQGQDFHLHVLVIRDQWLVDIAPLILRAVAHLPKTPTASASGFRHLDRYFISFPSQVLAIPGSRSQGYHPLGMDALSGP
ncbi:hypothetical protein LCGC14_0481400 [marine sediment metagenome]|uniref:Uncharacterized protein n=1 Tax=marine sediment metagenome TaxID=412755 RepID=A0A0F9S946_9ZZZZ